MIILSMEPQAAAYYGSFRCLHGRQAFGREATEAELQWGRRVLKELGGATEAAWKGLCHLMINRKEFIYVF